MAYQKSTKEKTYLMSPLSLTRYKACPLRSGYLHLQMRRLVSGICKMSDAINGSNSTLSGLYATQTFLHRLLRDAFFHHAGTSLSSLNPLLLPPALQGSNGSHYPTPHTLSLLIGYLLSPGLEFQTQAPRAVISTSPISGYKQT